MSTESYYHDFFQKTKSSVLILKENSIHYANNSALELFGYQMSEILSLHPSDLSPKLQADGEVSIIKADKMITIAIKNGSNIFEWRHCNKAGDIFWTEVTLTSIINKDSSMIFALINDISKRKDYEKEREQNQMILLKSQKMELISSLSSGLVHDLNNTLSIILGNTELLEISVNNRLQINPDNMLNIKTATQKANDILKHLLSISQRQTNTLQEIDLNDLIMDVFSILRNSFNKTVDLQLNLFQEPALLQGDRSQIEHMLLNVIINSYQAIFNNGRYSGTISLSLNKVKKNNEKFWLIKISDDGVGIPDNLISQVFDPFFTTKDSDRDLGLGLTSTKNIVESHNGFIEIQSDFGKGTEFSIFLPLYIESFKENKNILNKDAKQNTILLIDDEPLIIATVTAILEEFNHNVLSSLDGDEGIKIFKKDFNNIGLVILDMDMPNKSGLEVFYELKKISNDVKVIISSGYQNDERIKKVLDEGVKDFVPKPYSISTFINKVNSVLNT